MKAFCFPVQWAFKFPLKERGAQATDAISCGDACMTNILLA